MTLYLIKVYILKFEKNFILQPRLLHENILNIDSLNFMLILDCQQGDARLM